MSDEELFTKYYTAMLCRVDEIMSIDRDARYERLDKKIVKLSYYADLAVHEHRKRFPKPHFVRV